MNIKQESKQAARKMAIQLAIHMAVLGACMLMVSEAHAQFDGIGTKIQNAIKSAEIQVYIVIGAIWSVFFGVAVYHGMRGSQEAWNRVVNLLIWGVVGASARLILPKVWSAMGGAG